MGVNKLSIVYRHIGTVVIVEEELLQGQQKIESGAADLLGNGVADDIWYEQRLTTPNTSRRGR